MKLSAAHNSLLVAVVGRSFVQIIIIENRTVHGTTEVSGLSVDPPQSSVKKSKCEMPRCAPKTLNTNR